MPEQPRPEAVNDDAPQPAVLRAGHKVGQLLKPHSAGRLGINAAESRKDEARGSGLARGYVATMQLQLVVGENRRE